MGTNAAARPCMSCKASPATLGWATCEPCRRARAERGRAAAGLTDPDDLPHTSVPSTLAVLAELREPTVEELAALDAETEQEPTIPSLPPLPAVSPSRPAGRLYSCPDCLYNGNTAQALGAHRWHAHGTAGSHRTVPARNPISPDCGKRSGNQAQHAAHVCTPPSPAALSTASLDRFYELVDLAVGWSRIAPAHQQTALTVALLPSDDRAIVEELARRLRDRTSQIFDQLRATP